MSEIIRCDGCNGERGKVARLPVGWLLLDAYGLDVKPFGDWRNLMPLHFCSAICARDFLVRTLREDEHQ
jgi:hypothetical protein